jgi:hypothetical protein
MALDLDLEALSGFQDLHNVARRSSYGIERFG